MLKKKWLRIYLLLLLVLGGIGVHYIIPQTITWIKHPLITLLKPHVIQEVDLLPTYPHLNLTKFEYSSFDGTLIRGFYNQAPDPRGTVILLHGIRSNKDHLLPSAERLAGLGFNSVAIDLRGHNQSGGKHCTFGVKESRDISMLLNQKFMQKTKLPMGVWGKSLGGAVALQSMADESRIQFGIVESTFSHFDQIVGDYFEDVTGLSNQRFDQLPGPTGLCPSRLLPAKSRPCPGM